MFSSGITSFYLGEDNKDTVLAMGLPTAEIKYSTPREEMATLAEDQGEVPEPSEEVKQQTGCSTAEELKNLFLRSSCRCEALCHRRSSVRPPRASRRTDQRSDRVFSYSKSTMNAAVVNARTGVRVSGVWFSHKDVGRAILPPWADKQLQCCSARNGFRRHPYPNPQKRLWYLCQAMPTPFILRQ